MQNKEYEIIIGSKVKTIQDKRSKAMVANFPFEFPDGTRGVLIVCKLKDEPWNPSKDLKNLKLEFI